MSTLMILIKRNIKLFFKDKGMFFTSLVTPAILLVLYATFLGNTYRDSFVSAVPPGIQIAGDLFDGLVGKLQHHLIRFEQLVFYLQPRVFVALAAMEVYEQIPCHAHHEHHRQRETEELIAHHRAEQHKV